MNAISQVGLLEAIESQNAALSGVVAIERARVETPILFDSNWKLLVTFNCKLNKRTHNPMDFGASRAKARHYYQHLFG